MSAEKTLFDKKSALIIALLCLITSTGRFVMDSYLPSMPSMAQNLGVSGNSIELTLTCYLLGFSISQLFYGPLSDNYGRKLILIIGFILFLLANAICTFAASMPVLLIGRLFAGIGMGASGVLNRAIASDCFSGNAFSKAWSYTTTTLVIVLIVAPLVGSEIQTLYGWRANFILTTFYIFTTLIIIYFKLPETNLNAIHSRINSRHPQTESIKTFKTVLQNYKIILATPSFISGTLCYTLAFAGLISYFQISSFLLMEKFGLSSFEYGFTSLLIALCYMAGGLIVNHFVAILGSQNLLKMGIYIITLSGIFMGVLDQFETGIISLLLPICGYIIGTRIIIPNAIAHSFTGLRHLSGSTSGMIGFIQMLGSAIVSFIVSRFNINSPELLGVLFTILGSISLIIFYYPNIKTLFELPKFNHYNPPLIKINIK